MGVVTLNEFQTTELLPLKNTDGTFISRGPGVITQNMLIQGNSILSSIYLEDIDSATSVEVKYYDTTTGSNDGERFNLASHDPQSTNGVTDRVTVTRIHNKPIMEVTILGGSAQFGVMVTVVSSFATDLDAALVNDGDTFNATTTKAIPIACLNETTGLMEFIRCPLTVSIEDTGDAFYSDGTKATIPGSSVNLDSFLVPVGKTRNFQQVNVSSFGCGIFTLSSGATIIATGRTGPGSPNAYFTFNPRRPIAAGTSISLDFEQVAGEPACVVEWHLMASDL